MDNVLPARYGRLDFRAWLLTGQAQNLPGRLEKTFSISAPHGFQVLNVEPSMKDGGAFVHFGFTPEPGVSPATALNSIEKDVTTTIEKAGGIRTWLGLGLANIDRVKGKPWREASGFCKPEVTVTKRLSSQDLNMFPSPLLKIEFEGPDVHQELLYDIIRVRNSPTTEQRIEANLSLTAVWTHHEYDKADAWYRWVAKICHRRRFSDTIGHPSSELPAWPRSC